jgi:toxin ParE1/3/4
MNQPVDFTAEAIKDLSSIAGYTAEKWGHEQALRYAEALNEQFKKIAKEMIFSKVAFLKYPKVRVCRCEHHYIFFMHPRKSQKPVILAVLHERMNLLERLKERL